jgi:hypothetical protein
MSDSFYENFAYLIRQLELPEIEVVGCHGAKI